MTAIRKPRDKIILPYSERLPDSDITEEYVLKFPVNEMQTKILDLVYRFRMIDTKDINLALGYKSYPRLTENLKELHRGRFLDRRRRPAELRREAGGGGDENQIFHMLDLAGCYFIKSYYAMDKLSDVKWSLENNRVKFDYALHSIKISWAYAKIAAAAREVGANIFEAWCDRHMRLRFTTTKEYTFYPDMFFKLIKEKRTYGFFVEIDMGTMAIQSLENTSAFDQKVFYYEEFRNSGKSYLGLNTMPKCLVITTTTQRAESLAKSVKLKQDELGKSGVTFLFTTFASWNKNPLGKIFIKSDFDQNQNRQFFSMFD